MYSEEEEEALLSSSSSLHFPTAYLNPDWQHLLTCAQLRNTLSVENLVRLVAFLASDAAAGVTGQAIGAGGDRLQLWTHPEAAATEFREGGWGYQDLVENFGALFGDKLQSVGEEFLQLPEELQPEPAEVR